MSTFDTIAQSSTIVRNTAEWLEAITQFEKRTKPTFFHARAQLPDQGRTNIVLGATHTLSVVLKTYASGGENELHAHTNEDHMFFILQGSATFRGPNGEIRIVSKNEGIVLPRGSFYSFVADKGEALVMLRVGATIDGTSDPLARVGIDELPLDGFSEANKEVPLVLSDAWFT
ncbi:cupin domain-containing protein [Caballeronia sp. LP006]|uniref:cupin domain-containing protein n=1 Tax=Caballeronia sp. LP006 TaxID=3038552 RepID=UPI00285669EB|nr:cupin domain-containing protein [Caballeronia sp. LP006]MDR5826294.1 cupin domain-containing protein [Caballeronia sp. LP006]